MCMQTEKDAAQDCRKDKLKPLYFDEIRKCVKWVDHWTKCSYWKSRWLGRKIRLSVVQLFCRSIKKYVPSFPSFLVKSACVFPDVHFLNNYVTVTRSFKTHRTLACRSVLRLRPARCSKLGKLRETSGSYRNIFSEFCTWLQCHMHTM